MSLVHLHTVPSLVHKTSIIGYSPISIIPENITKRDTLILIHVNDVILSHGGMEGKVHCIESQQQHREPGLSFATGIENSHKQTLAFQRNLPFPSSRAVTLSSVSASAVRRSGNVNGYLCLFSCLSGIQKADFEHDSACRCNLCPRSLFTLYVIFIASNPDVHVIDRHNQVRGSPIDKSYVLLSSCQSHFQLRCCNFKTCRCGRLLWVG